MSESPDHPVEPTQAPHLRRILLKVWNPAQATRIMLAGEGDPPGSEPLVLPQGVFDALFADVGASDGDEVEILVRKTGRRPWAS